MVMMEVLDDDYLVQIRKHPPQLRVTTTTQEEKNEEWYVVIQVEIVVVHLRQTYYATAFCYL